MNSDNMAKARAAKKRRSKLIRAEIPKAARVRLESVPEHQKSQYLLALSGKSSARQAIKAFCLECVGWKPDDVRNCQGYACPLYLYRPFKRTDELTEWREKA